MALKVRDRVKESTTTTGTGAVTLSGASANFQTFSSVLSNADTTFYAIIDDTNNEFEVGLGTFASSGNTITRTTVLESSNSGSAVDFGAGTKQIFMTYPAEKSVFLDANNHVELTGGAISLKNAGSQSRIDFYCESSNAHYARLQAPAHSAFSGNVTITLPATTDTLVGKTTTDTLTNKTLTSPTISSPAITGTATFGGSSGVSISQGAVSIKNGGTQSYVDFYCESSNAHYARLQAPAHSAFSGNITLTLPATTDTLVGKTTTDTLTNKTLTSPTISGASTTIASPAITGTATFGGASGVSISQGAISIKNGGTQSYVDFYCESSNAHYARLQAPAHSAFSGNITLTMPATTGTIALTSDVQTTEQIQDLIGAMFSSNTETGITVDYQDDDGTIDLVIADASTSAKGLASFSSDDFSVSSGAVTIKSSGITNTQLAGSIANSKLANSSISFGGISLALGASDATPAFDLSDATNYPTSSLSGTITNAQLAGSIANSKLANSSITVSDGSNTTATALGGTITFSGTSNEVDVVESSGTITIGLPDDVTIGQNLTVTGNLTVSGTTTQTGAVTTNDNFNILSNNNSANNTDFGLAGKYVESSTTKYAGIFYDASTDNTFRLFCDTQTEPSTTVNTSATGYTAANLIIGALTASSITIGSTAVSATAAELNILDGVTSTTAELNILDGVTATASELNILDGVTSTTSELNLLDGGTSASSSITIADADRFIVNDNGTMKQIAASDLKTYTVAASADDATALAIALG